MAAIEKEDARPDVNRMLVTSGEVMVQAGQKQLLDACIALVSGQRICGGKIGSRGIGHSDQTPSIIGQRPQSRNREIVCSISGVPDLSL